jgi:hypothetical protein
MIKPGYDFDILQLIQTPVIPIFLKIVAHQSLIVEL